ncbi:hypothetical protein M3Y97_00761500 [Aphelenchoides bicaudatus]|nr:hypothetical protein M3Y97_00761500 [Aphelenchoides bicaudatus]
MMNIDLKKALHLKVLDAGYIYFDLSHHSLQKRQLQRYLPDMASDLNSNPYLKNVDFIFNTIDETSNCDLEQIITDRMPNKKVTLIFLKARPTCNY